MSVRLAKTVLCLWVAVTPHGVASGADTGTGIAGRWLTEDSGGVIDIAPCGYALCGRIVGMGEFEPDGSAHKDFSGRSQCGLEIFHRLIEDEPGLWAGTVTNPQDGHTYRLHAQRDPDGRLRIRGFLGLSVFGSTQFWTPFRGLVTPDCHIER